MMRTITAFTALTLVWFTAHLMTQNILSLVPFPISHPKQTSFHSSQHSTVGLLSHRLTEKAEGVPMLQKVQPDPEVIH